MMISDLPTAQLNMEAETEHCPLDGIQSETETMREEKTGPSMDDVDHETRADSDSDDTIIQEMDHDNEITEETVKMDEVESRVDKDPEKENDDDNNENEDDGKKKDDDASFDENKDDDNDDSYDDDTIRKRKKSSSKSVNECKVCGRHFSQHSGLKVHMRTHTGERPFSCDKCEKRFIDSSNLIKHQRVHEDNKPYKCGVCGVSFSDSSNRTKHMSVHNGALYECDICGKRMTSNQGLKVHMRTHTGDRPFECTQCEKKFIVKNQLKLHIMSHNGEYTHECSMCPKRFLRSMDLKSHELTHKKDKCVPCNLCGRKFISEKYMRKHILRIHSTDRPVQPPPAPVPCPVCKRSFASKGNLTHHMRAHDANGLLFLCAYCAAQFGDLTDLRQHEEVVHHAASMRRKKKTQDVRVTKSYLCSICGNQYDNASLVRYHETNVHGLPFVPTPREKRKLAPKPTEPITSRDDQSGTTGVVPVQVENAPNTERIVSEPVASEKGVLTENGAHNSLPVNSNCGNASPTVEPEPEPVEMQDGESETSLANWITEWIVSKPVESVKGILTELPENSPCENASPPPPVPPEPEPVEMQDMQSEPVEMHDMQSEPTQASSSGHSAPSTQCSKTVTRNELNENGFDEPGATDSLVSPMEETEPTSTFPRWYILPKSGPACV